MSRAASWLLVGGGAVVAVVVAAACQTPTSITFELRTDVDCASASSPPSVAVVLSREANLEGRTGEPSATKPCEVSTTVGTTERIGSVVALPAGDEDTVEVSMRVVMGLGRPSEGCGVEPGLDGDPWSGCLVARRRLAFLSGEALTVEVPLYADCIGVPCDEVSTCVPDRGCVPAAVDPDSCLGAGCGDDELAPQTVASSAQATTSTGSTGNGTGGDGGAGGGGGGGDGGAGPTTSSTADVATSTGTGGATCGNDVVEEGEACDDGNLVGGDGCEPDCTLGPGECPDPEATCLDGQRVGGVCETVIVDTCTEQPGGLCDACGRCCQGGGCVPAGCPDGAPCNVANECDSGFCFVRPGDESGVCCGTFCDATLTESCLQIETGVADGTCGPVVQ